MPLCAANARASARLASTTSSKVLSLQPIGTLVMACASPTSALQGGWKHTPHPRRPRRAESGTDVHNYHRPGAFSWCLRILVVTAPANSRKAKRCSFWYIMGIPRCSPHWGQRRCGISVRARCWRPS